MRSQRISAFRAAFIASFVAELDSAGLERLLPDSARPSDESLAAQLNIDDPQIVAIMGNMLAEAAAGCPSGSLYGESLSLALAAYVAARYSVKMCRPERVEHGFSRTQLQTVIDYIHAHLKDDLSLIELAAAINLSPRHFSRLFRKTFGTTAYRYVMDERINRVKTLLATKRAVHPGDWRGARLCRPEPPYERVQKSHWRDSQALSASVLMPRAARATLRGAANVSAMSRICKPWLSPARPCAAGRLRSKQAAVGWNLECESGCASGSFF